MLGTFTLELNTTIYSVQGFDIKSYLHIAALNNSAIAPLYLVLIRRNQHQSIKPHNWFCKKTYVIHVVLRVDFQMYTNLGRGRKDQLGTLKAYPCKYR